MIFLIYFALLLGLINGSFNPPTGNSFHNPDFWFVHQWDESMNRFVIGRWKLTWDIELNILANEIIENEKTLIASCAALGSSEVTVSWASDDEEIQNQIDQLEAATGLGTVKGTYCLKGRCFLRLCCKSFSTFCSDWLIYCPIGSIYLTTKKV